MIADYFDKKNQKINVDGLKGFISEKGMDKEVAYEAVNTYRNEWLGKIKNYEAAGG